MSSPNAFLVGVFVVVCSTAIYVVWRLAVAVRQRRGWHEIAARVLYLTGVGMFLYTLGTELWREEAPPGARFPVDYLVYVACGLLLLGQIVYRIRPRSAETR